MFLRLAQPCVALLGALCTAVLAIDGLSKRIVGGKVAEDGEFPFTVFVSSPELTDNTACAGAILTEQIIVTAAYCVYDKNTKKATDPSKVQVGYGRSSRSEQPSVSVQHIIIHDSYNASSGVGDIALLQVDLADQISDDVNRIAVDTGNIQPHDELTFMGWGVAERTGLGISDQLNYGNVTVGDDFNCGAIDLYQNSNGRAICTRTALSPGVGPCVGDYGGSLIKYDQGVPKLVGIMSELVTPDGKPIDLCDNSNIMVYYTHVSYYMSFLEKSTKLSQNTFTGNAPLESAKSDGGLSKGAIAGIAVAGAAVLILLGVLGYVLFRNMKKRAEAQQGQRIYELGLQQLADELGGSYEPKVSSAMSVFHSSGITPLDDAGLISRASMAYRYIRRSTYSDSTHQPFSENIPQISEVGTEISMDTLSRTFRHTDGSPKIMDYIRAERDGKISDYYRHLLFYQLEEPEDNEGDNSSDGDDLISL